MIDFKKKVGPLPVWGWTGIGAGAGVAAFVIIRRRKAAAAAAASASSDASTLGTPDQASTAVGDSGEQSYYYGPADSATAATPATTATQSQLAAATKLQTQIAQLEANAKAEGVYQGLIQSKVGGAASQKVYATNKSKIDATITAINQQIAASITGVEVPAGLGTTTSSTSTS